MWAGKAFKHWLWGFWCGKTRWKWDLETRLLWAGVLSRHHPALNYETWLRNCADICCLSRECHDNVMKLSQSRRLSPHPDQDHEADKFLLRPGIAPNLYRQVWAQCWAPLWACYKDLNCRSPMILLDLMADNPNWIKQDKGAWDWFKIFDIIPSEPGHRRTVITSYFLFYIKTRSRLAASSHIQFLWCSHQQILSGKVIRPEWRRVILPPTPWWTLSMVSIMQPD